MTNAFEHKIVKYEFGWKGFDYAEIERHLTELGAQGWDEATPLTTSSPARATRHRRARTHPFPRCR